MISTPAKSQGLPPTLLTIFGITGDLARIKLLPALYQLESQDSLPKEFYIVGITRRQLTTRLLRKQLIQELQKSGTTADKKVINRFFKRFYVGKFEITQEADYPEIRKLLDGIEAERGVCFNRLFYLAIPPTLFAPVITKLGAGGLHLGCQHRRGQSRLLIEKPFGFDEASAKELINQIGRHFKENQVYRIDHYLAKETVLNILNFRFENPLIESLFNSQLIDHVQITAAEDIGIGSRINFFEQTGALRDMIQSHLLQILTLVAMERPPNNSADSIHKHRLAVLNSLRPIKPNQVDKLAVRGQYTANKIGSKDYSGYRQKVGNPRSNTETYAALQVEIDNPRWRGVPFFIRAGKRLPQKVTDITIVFKGKQTSKDRTNTLTLRLQPNEGIALDLLVKKPGLAGGLEPVQMDFCYRHRFSERHLDAHARLILNAIQGDRTLFPTSKEVMAAWHFIQPILHSWQQTGTSLQKYKASTWGPAAADKLMARHGEWLAARLNICPPEHALLKPPS